MATKAVKPEKTARRVALWRALHTISDAHPLVFDDPIAVDLADPPPSWRTRGDMGRATARSRASTVARARVTDDIVEEQIDAGVSQYVILGAGLDTFAQRRMDLKNRLKIFEIDQAGPQQWKENRLRHLGLTDFRPTFVPVNFEQDESWWTLLVQSGFDAERPAVFASTGLSMYLTHETNEDIFREIGTSSAASTFITSFIVPIELVEQAERKNIASVTRGTHRYGTPWLSFYSPDEIIALAYECGFKSVEHISPGDLTNKYFKDRTDGLVPSSAEHLLIART